MRLLQKFLIAALLTMVFIACQSTKQSTLPAAGMFKVAIYYASGEGKTFDMEYYEKKHMPMVAGFLGDNLKGYEIDKGVSGRMASDAPSFLAVGYFYVRNIEEYNAAIGKNREAVVADFKSYTNIQPVIQISEIRAVVVNTKK